MVTEPPGAARRETTAAAPWSVAWARGACGVVLTDGAGRPRELAGGWQAKAWARRNGGPPALAAVEVSLDDLRRLQDRARLAARNDPRPPVLTLDESGRRAAAAATREGAPPDLDQHGRDPSIAGLFT